MVDHMNGFAGNTNPANPAKRPSDLTDNELIVALRDDPEQFVRTRARTPRQVTPDISSAEAHFRAFMVALGLDPADPHLADTPSRVAKMYATELFRAEPYTFTTFPTEGDSLIVVRDIPFVSLCAHHWLPFSGVAHVGYIPRDRMAGLSKLARVVDEFARAPQVQERLTSQVADALVERLDPIGVGVLIHARHECMEIRGVQKVGTSTVTSALRGALIAEPEARAEFLSLCR